MNEYFWWSGVFFNVMICGIGLFLLWFLFLYPILQAVSLARVCIRALGNERNTSALKIHWWAQKELFLGKSFECIRTNKFEWCDIGDWKIYSEEEN